MSNRESIANLLFGLNEVFPEFSFTKNSMSLYVEALEPEDFDKLRIAVKKCVSSCRCFPKPVELIELAGQC